MKKTLIGISTVATALFMGSTYAAPNLGFADLSGELTFTTDYRAYGASQTERRPAIQASLELAFPIGIYANIWGSNTNLPDVNSNIATSEIDLSMGYRNHIQDLNYDIGVVRYEYPKAVGLDYNDVYLLLDYHDVNLEVYHSSDSINSNEPGTYAQLGVNYPIDHIISGAELFGWVGHFWLSTTSSPDYTNYALGITKGINKNTDVAVQWEDTNLRNDPNANSRILFSITSRMG